MSCIIENIMRFKLESAEVSNTKLLSLLQDFSEYFFAMLIVIIKSKESSFPWHLGGGRLLQDEGEHLIPSYWVPETH